jgi:hypothetical protein
MITIRSRGPFRRGMAVALVVAGALLLGSPGRAGAQERRTTSEWIQDTGAHKIAGFATLGLAAATAIAGALDSDAHPSLGYATVGASALTLTLGGLGYRDSIRSIWPHVLMNTLAATGYALNAFALEGGSNEHIATGAASIALMSGAILYIVLR